MSLSSVCELLPCEHEAGKADTLFHREEFLKVKGVGSERRAQTNSCEWEGTRKIELEVAVNVYCLN